MKEKCDIPIFHDDQHGTAVITLAGLNNAMKLVKKQKENKIIYAGKYQIASNFTGKTKEYIIDLLKTKKCSELMLRN